MMKNLLILAFVGLSLVYAQRGDSSSYGNFNYDRQFHDSPYQYQNNYQYQRKFPSQYDSLYNDLMKYKLRSSLNFDSYRYPSNFERDYRYPAFKEYRPLINNNKFDPSKEINGYEKIVPQIPSFKDEKEMVAQPKYEVHDAKDVSDTLASQDMKNKPVIPSFKGEKEMVAQPKYEVHDAKDVSDTLASQDMKNKPVIPLLKDEKEMVAQPKYEVHDAKDVSDTLASQDKKDKPVIPLLKDEKEMVAKPKYEVHDVKKNEPVKAEPVKAEPVKAEPVKAEPIKAEPVKAEPVKADVKIVNANIDSGSKYDNLFKDTVEDAKPEITDVIKEDEKSAASLTEVKDEITIPNRKNQDNEVLGKLDELDKMKDNEVSNKQIHGGLNDQELQRIKQNNARLQADPRERLQLQQLNARRQYNRYEDARPNYEFESRRRFYEQLQRDEMEKAYRQRQFLERDQMLGRQYDNRRYPLY